MRVLFLTNQAAYHQMHFARAMVARLGVDNFRIVFQKPTSAARAEMGWQDDYPESFVLRYWRSPDEVYQWIDQADVVIQGRFPTRLVKARIKRGQLTFACQERLWKKPPTLLRKISRLGHLYKNYISVNKANYHFLAIGQFAAQDLNDLGFFKGRSWRFGYFIDLPKYKERKIDKQIKLLWCARMTDVKQPHRALEILESLLHSGRDVYLNMIGDGDLRHSLEHMITNKGLSESVSLLGWQSQHQVFEYMSQADLFLMTSHQGEGWGLVVNEALSHGCAVIANAALGSAASLVKEDVSGLLYTSDGLSSLFERLANKDVAAIHSMGKAGYQSMQKMWSADLAAQRTIKLSELLLKSDIEAAKALYKGGPCSFIS